MTPHASLPEPELNRWQPLRIGLLNIYRFTDEVFVFEKGRMILRGNNGTGKSRVIALTLPFLLDADIRPHRVEPDGDPAKRIEWNLLMGKHADRLGYTWAEFGIVRPDGTKEYFTLGCGLKAAEGRGLVDHWFFTTSQRVGKDLFLTSEKRALSKAGLEDALGGHGKIYAKVSLYRAAVDSALYGLGSRYGSLNNLLVTLRKPQLSRDLDEKALAGALSEAMTPLSEDLLGEIAEAFRALEADRVELDNLKGSNEAVEKFLTGYRHYVQIYAKQYATTVLAERDAYNNVVKSQRRHESEARKAKEELLATENRRESLRARAGEIQAEQSGLREGPQMESSRNLTAALKDAQDATVAAENAEQDLGAALDQVGRSEAVLAGLNEKADSITRTVKRLSEQCLSAAVSAGLAEDHSQAVDDLDLETMTESRPIEAARSMLTDSINRRISNIGHLEPLQKAFSDAETELARAKEAQEQIASRLADARERQVEMRRVLEVSIEATLNQYRNWVGLSVVLHPESADSMDDAFPAWAENGSGNSPLVKAVDAAWRTFQHSHSEAKAAITQRQKANHALLEKLHSELAGLMAGHHTPPVPPATRDVEVRKNRTGAALWALCDFNESLSHEERSGIEAALEASGLLDAWVTPDGQLLGPGNHDTVVALGISSAAPKGQSLAEVLHPEAGTTVSAEVITAVLQHIGYGEGAGTTWVDSSGQWQLGPLRGEWSKTAPQHIGASAREAERMRKIDENRAQTDLALEQKAQIAAEEEALEAQLHTARKESEEAPSDSDVRQAISDEQSERRNVTRLLEDTANAEKRTGQRKVELQAAQQALLTDARELRLEEWIGKFSELKNAVILYRGEMQGFWPHLQRLAETRSQIQAAEIRRHEDEAVRGRKAEALEAAKGKKRDADVRYATLLKSVGASVEDLHRRIAELDEELRVVNAGLEECGAGKEAASNKLAVAESNLTRSQDELATSEKRQEAAASALGTFASKQLLGVVNDEFRDLGSTEWDTQTAVEIATRIAALLEDVRIHDVNWGRAQNSIVERFEELKNSLLPRGFSPELESVGEQIGQGAFVVRIPYNGRAVTMSDMRAELSNEITHRESLLAARDREVIENYLIDEAASALHARLAEAEDWVRGANDELMLRPMATGMTLRFRWTPREDGPPGLVEARKLLLRLSSTWSPAERKSLGDFLHSQIQMVRQKQHSGTWLQHLAEALDYREWHLVTVEQRRDGVWRRLTKATHGTGSGGEKAIALTMPQLAAAAAYYRSNPTAPRLIVLDEAFVGVDSDMRRDCMGLLTSFDLDFVMTSENEWGAYNTVPAVAIYQLARRDGIDAIGSTRFVWNGKRKDRDMVVHVTATEPELVVAPQVEEFQLDGN